jgi:hypothetical protein
MTPDEHARRIRAAWKLMKSAQAQLKELVATIPRDKFKAAMTEAAQQLKDQKNDDRK